MPLSKKKQAEYQARRRKIVIPNDEFHWRDHGKQPIPNRPDGSHR